MHRLWDESQKGKWIREGENLLLAGYTQEKYEEYYNAKKKYKYIDRGVGYIQTTFQYNHFGFATYLLGKDNLDLPIKIKYSSSANAIELEDAYNTAMNIAMSNGIDIEEYQKILEGGTDYIASQYAWTISGYWWLANKVNEEIDAFEGNCASEVDKISDIVNKGMSSSDRAERRAYYEQVSKIIK